MISTLHSSARKTKERVETFFTAVLETTDEHLHIYRDCGLKNNIRSFLFPLSRRTQSWVFLELDFLYVRANAPRDDSTYSASSWRSDVLENTSSEPLDRRMRNRHAL